MRAARRVLVDPKGLNSSLELPYAMTTEEIGRALQHVYDIIHTINTSLILGGADRLEDFMHPANFSFLLSELIVGGLAKHSKRLTKNRHHNGHPDLLPTGVYPGDARLRAEEGVEVKCSRHESGWQGHNAEASWVFVAVYRCDLDSSLPVQDRAPTCFARVMIAHLEKTDWSFAGRKGNSRRTPTASILRSGTRKLMDETVYLPPETPVLDV